MTTTFTPPPIETKATLGAIELIPSFRIDLALEAPVTETTVRGHRIHQRVVGGPVEGPRLSGQVYAQGGGEYGLVRKDDVAELFTRFMIIADNGEWLYSQLVGYVRQDGYARFQATFDADAQGPHSWLNENIFIGTIEERNSGRQRILNYFEAA